MSKITRVGNGYIHSDSALRIVAEIRTEAQNCSHITGESQRIVLGLVFIVIGTVDIIASSLKERCIEINLLFR